MELDEFIHRCKHAWETFVTGDPEPAMFLFSRREDVTLANPWGPPVTGWSAVSETLRAAASRFRNGRVSEFDVRSGSCSEELAWYHEIERGEAMLGGRSELEPFALRVTTVYRREEDGWRIVLRHGDPIVEARPADAGLSSGTGS